MFRSVSAVCLAVLFLFALIVPATAAPIRRTDEPTTTTASVVPLLTIGGYLPERNNPFDFFSSGIGTLHDYTRTIRHAGKDFRVAGLMIHFEQPALGLAQAMEFEAALRDFRESGKPLYIYSDGFDIVSYTASTPASKLVIAPVGGLDLRGIGFSLYYFKDLLAKLGVQAEVVNEGRYKNAFEPFTHSAPTPATLEQMGVLMEDLFTTWAETVARNRKIDVAVARELLVGGPYTTGAALEKGLVDDAMFPHQLEDAIVEELGEEITFDTEYWWKPRGDEKPLNIMGLLTGSFGTKKKKRATDAKKIVVVYALGPIIDGRSDGGNPLAPEQAIASEDLIDLLRAATDEVNVAAIVLRVDSPGGSAIASDRIWGELQRIRDEGVPIVASMGEVAASGGYYISVAADHIVAEPTTITGSIGVIGGKMNLGGTYGMIGVARHGIAIGPNAELFNEADAWSDSERAVLMTLMDDVYDAFTTRVAEGRGMTQEDVIKVAEGRIWSGRSALEAGLVDELGGLETAIAVARRLARDPNAAVEEFPRAMGPTEFLERMLSGEITSRVPARSSALRSAIVTWQRQAAPVIGPAMAARAAAVLTAFDQRPVPLALWPLCVEVRR